jgi:hypothetical protein
VADCCRLGPDLSVPVTRLREEYETWCKSEGIKHPILGKSWGDALKALGCKNRRTPTTRFWDGIDVRLIESPGPREPGEDESPW